jgi:hypothetical protein
MIDVATDTKTFKIHVVENPDKVLNELIKKKLV